ncbi:MAG: hypothetical protein WEB85_16525 [Dongiaceae bacterium]
MTTSCRLPSTGPLLAASLVLGGLLAPPALAIEPAGRQPALPLQIDHGAQPGGGRDLDRARCRPASGVDFAQEIGQLLDLCQSMGGDSGPFT